MVKITKKSFADYFKRALPELCVIVGVIIFDLLSKALVSHLTKTQPVITLIPKFLHIHYTINYAAAFSFDFGLTKLLGNEGMRIALIIFMSLAVMLFFFFLVKGVKYSVLYRVSLGMIIGGAVGNLYDRIFIGGVRDFVEFEFLGYEFFGYKYFAIFNIADSALVIGMILFAVYVIFFLSKDEEKDKKPKAEEAEQPRRHPRSQEADE